MASDDGPGVIGLLPTILKAMDITQTSPTDGKAPVLDD